MLDMDANGNCEVKEFRKGHLSVVVPSLDTFTFDWGGGYG